MSSPVATHARATWQRRLPFFYGWVIVAVAFLSGYMLSALTWTVGVLALPMSADLGWSRTAIFGAINVRSYVSVALSPFLGRFFDAPQGPRVLNVLGGVVCALSAAPIAFVSEEWQFFVLFGVLGGVASALVGGQLAAAIVPKWFLRQRGPAMTWATMGQALSVMTVPLFIGGLLQAATWRETWLVLAAATLVLVALPALLVRRQPEDLGLLPDGAPAPSDGARPTPPADEVSFTLREAARTPQFYVLAFGCSIGALAIIGLPVSLTAMYATRGFSTEFAVFAAALFGACSLLGRFFWGFFVARYPIRWVLVAVAAMGAVASPVLYLAEGPLALAYVVLAGLANGGYFGFSPLLWPQYYGRRHLGAITGATRPFTMVVMGSGAGMMALTFDLTGSYATGLGVISLTWLLVAASMVLARPPRRPRAA